LGVFPAFVTGLSDQEQYLVSFTGNRGKAKVLRMQDCKYPTFKVL